MFSEFVAPVVNVDVVFSIILVAIQRMIDKQFVCPCHRENNFFYDAFLSCSSLIIICLTLLIQMHQLRKNKKSWKRIRSFMKSVKKVCKHGDGFCGFWSFTAKLCHVVGISLALLIPVLMWVIMWYFDGDLYVCVLSSWDGIWERSSTLVPPYWCKPHGNGTFDELKRKSAEWFLQSQHFSMQLLCGLTACIIAYSFFLIYVSVTDESEEKKRPKEKTKILQ